MKAKLMLGLSGLVSLALAQNAMAACSDVNRNTLLAIATAVVNEQDIPGPLGNLGDNGGFGLDMWVTMVDETGKVCHVVNTAGSGALIGNSSWLGSRVISAQKANTANAFSLDGYAISTGILYGTVQDNNSLFGLQHSNPVDAEEAYDGSPNNYGTHNDPLKGERPGGINVFGGGHALYLGGVKVGAIGVSGDTSCTDHVVSWKIRKALGMDAVPNGFTTANFNANGTPLALGGDKGDEIIIDFDNSDAASVGWKHPACPNTPPDATDEGAILFK